VTSAGVALVTGASRSSGGRADICDDSRVRTPPERAGELIALPASIHASLDPRAEMLAHAAATGSGDLDALRLRTEA
jgi:hypothetical protein